MAEEAVHFIRKDIEGMDKCARCESPDVIVALKVPDVVKGIWLENIYPACRKCCEETGVELPAYLKEETKNNTNL